MNRSAADSWTEELAAQIGMRTRITYRVPPTPSGVIDAVSVAREALVWLDDAHAFGSHRRRTWQQLRDDLELSLRELGPELHARLAPAVAAMTPSLELRQGAAADERLRAATEVRRLLASLDSGDAVVAAWHGLIAVSRDDVASPELCDLREAQLAALAKLGGFGSSSPVSSGAPSSATAISSPASPSVSTGCTSASTGGRSLSASPAATSTCSRRRT